MGASACDGLGLWPWRASYSLPSGAFLRLGEYPRVRYSKKYKCWAEAVSCLGLGAGGGGPLIYRACIARRRIDGVASHRSSSSCRKTQRESGDGGESPHG